MKIGPVIACAAVLVLASAPALRAQEERTIFDIGSDLIRGELPEEVEDIRELFTPPRPEEWQAFWKDVMDALQSETLDELSWMDPFARRGLEILRLLPQGRPYADWLQQRLDYFDMADAVTRAVPVAPSPAQPTPAPQPPPPQRPAPKTVVAPRRPAAPPVPAAVSTKRLAAARSQRAWTDKLARRPPPANATTMVPGLKNIFQSEGVPPQLVWLAEVESSMNPQARSPVGAAGLYQFMPATAQRFGLKTAPTDERLVPEKSARAAAQYLKYLHRQFDSWPLALAAYNAGEGRVGRLVKGSSDKTFEGIAPKLPVETQMYVPKVLATVALRENMDASKLPPPTAWRRVPRKVVVVARVF